jgi:23S rRNA pseudouridine1911/1915/1917 synthase
MASANADSAPSLSPAILFEDDAFIVLDKPAGLVVHSDGRTTEPSVSEWLHARNPELKDIGGQHTLDSGRYLPRYGLLHRIDRETSGVILVAKNEKIFYDTQRQFLDRSIAKVYHAFVHGVPSPQKGVVSLSIGRSRKDFRQWTTGEEARGTLRPAVTEYTVIAEKDGISELELHPKTGRTHQIRVHMKALGHPLVSDKRYGGATALGFSRLALHARSLTLRMPDGSPRTFEAPFPADFVFGQKTLRS